MDLAALTQEVRDAATLGDSYVAVKRLLASDAEEAMTYACSLVRTMQ